MTSIAAGTRANETLARRETLADRLVAAVPLAGAYLLLCVVYAWHALSHGSPWLFSDELEYAQLSRAIAETGEPALRGEPQGDVSLYTYLLAPVWWISDTQTAYTAAKYLGVFVMTSALFPAYGLARMLVPRWPALFAGVATAAVPMLAYSRLIVTEVLAYPFAALCFFVAAKALATWSRYWLAALLVLLLVAPAVRNQLLVLWPTVALAALVALWLSPPARRFRRDWGVLQWTAAAVGLAVLVRIAHQQAISYSERYYITTTLPDRMEEFMVWAAGAFAIGLGVFPFVVGLAALWRPRDGDLPAYRALAGLLVGGIVSFGLYTVVKTVYVSTVFANVVAERNLVYLAPLVFVATALFLHRPGGNPIAFVASGALAGYLVVEAPFQLDHYPYFDAPGLSVLAVFNRELWLDDPAIERMLLWIVAGSVILAAGAALARGRAVPVARVSLAVVAAAVVGWNLTGLVSFGNGVNDLGNRLLGAVPNPPNWIDRATAGKSTAYLGQAIADGNPIYLSEFWNQSIVHVGSLDGTAPGPGPTLTSVPYRRDGSVLNDPETEYLVTNSAGVEPFGALVERAGDWRLYRIGGKLRLRQAVAGVYPDGWTGGRAGYSFFGTGQEGVLDVVVSREGWGGEDKPGKVTIRVGDLVPAPLEVIQNPCSGGECVSRDPRIGRVYGESTWTAHARQKQLFQFRVRTPFRLEITTEPTFSPSEFGETDLRQLGVQAAVAFKPSR